MMISIDFNAQIFWRYFSVCLSRCVSFSVFRKKLSATSKRNVHPNPAMVVCEAVSMSAYLFGSNNANLNAAIGLIFHTIATIINGNNILIPKTAMAIPRVRNLCCHFGVIFFNTVAFTTALSNDNDISNIPKMRTMKIVCSPADIFIISPAQRKNAMMIAIIVNRIDHLKCFMLFRIYKVEKILDYQFSLLLFIRSLVWLYLLCYYIFCIMDSRVF